jgi:hypothetical protein
VCVYLCACMCVCVCVCVCVCACVFASVPVYGGDALARHTHIQRHTAKTHTHTHTHTRTHARTQTSLYLIVENTHRRWVDMQQVLRMHQEINSLHAVAVSPVCIRYLVTIMVLYVGSTCTINSLNAESSPTLHYGAAAFMLQ